VVRYPAALSWGRPAPEAQVEIAASIAAYRRYLRDLVDVKAREPGDDLTSDLLAIHAEDGPGARSDWLVAGRPGAVGAARGNGPADCAVTGPARDLYLTLWNRGPADGLRVTGDLAVLAAFGTAMHITWD